MEKHVLEVNNLTKHFGKFTAVDNISFKINEGEILGFLGPNGAGKTTTLQMLLGVLTPSSGSIRYFGHELATHREMIMEQVNFSSTYTNLPWYLSVKENLTYISYLYNIKNRRKRVQKVIETFRLQDLVNKSISQLSAGQQTRVNLAKAFLNYPKILLLDEPTASLDPDVALYIREFLERERKQFNVTIVITSHNMAEVEELCDRVIFINHGKLIADDTPLNLAKSIEISHIELLITKGIQKLTELTRTHDIQFRVSGKHHIFDVKEKQIANFLKVLSDQGIVYEEISIEKPSLEDYFLQASQRGRDI
jgi:ABC-2 type transport system ATP-binding protein